MNCNEAIEYIHSLERFGINPGLERIEYLCEKLGNPQKNLKFIHIAGTNGKGSTSTLSANMLIEAGYNVGLYTSPYVIDFRERIQFNGNMIEPEELSYCVSVLKEIIGKNTIKATEFEVTTAAAFLYFYRKNCDFVVLEVGLGGRFDATNIIDKPEVSVITSISLDHTAILGDTIEKIAFEKCGIIKSNTSVVSYPLQKPDAYNIIKNSCAERECSLTVPDVDKLKLTKSSEKGTDAEYDGIAFTIRLAGKHMIYNCITAIEAVKKTAPNISDVFISAGINKTIMPARMELISENPLIILDGGHNEDCANALREFIKTNIRREKIIMVSSIMADKEYDKYLSIVLPLADEFVATQADIPRALPFDELASDAKKYCDTVSSIRSSKEAVLKAIKSADEKSAIIICGSFYLAGEIRNMLLEEFKND